MSKTCLLKECIHSTIFVVFTKPFEPWYDSRTDVLWSEEFPVRTTVRWSGVSEKTVIDWYNFCRDTCAEYMLRNLTVIGGPGKIVEIDEAKFGKRKYNRGRYRDGRWVIGGHVTWNKENVVAARDAATILPLIQRNVAAGSIIQTDEWASYV